MVADSRDVALNHTAGLSLPQQLQMTLFSLFALLDEDDALQQALPRHRARALREAVRRAGHRRSRTIRCASATTPTSIWRPGGAHTFGEEFMGYVEAHHDPLDIVLALAQRYGTVLLNGSGFDGPPWSARVSLANLDAEDYAAIGRDLREIARAAVAQWRRSVGRADQTMTTERRRWPMRSMSHGRRCLVSAARWRSTARRRTAPPSRSPRSTSWRPAAPSPARRPASSRTATSRGRSRSRT